MSKDYYKARLMMELSRATGKNRAVSMGQLFERVFQEEYVSKINGTRKLRTLITELRKEGVPVGSVSASSGGGYYLASAGSELDDYCRRIRNRALKLLAMESQLREVPMSDLLRQLQLNSTGEEQHAQG